MQLASTSEIRCLERGCPQESVPGAIFCNIIINDLLFKLNNLTCCEIIAFADDILVCSQGRDLSATFLHTHDALNLASDWENLSASSICNYDCILSSLFLPHPSGRNAINIIQFSDKITDDFPLICYTNGSKIDERVGFAFVVFRSGVESNNFHCRIRDECIFFVVEFLCLNFAVKWITEQSSVISKYLIYTNSLSSLHSLKRIFKSYKIIVKIQKQLKSLKDKNISIDFAFVHGHTGVLGNERADWLAKAATKSKIDTDVNIPKTFYKKITKERMVKS
ncbi:RNase H domain-containing protein [Trichonephila clavipes]|nr:RNase H domain-containing protein [Trichonephila clavipes]